MKNSLVTGTEKGNFFLSLCWEPGSYKGWGQVWYCPKLYRVCGVGDPPTKCG